MPGMETDRSMGSRILVESIRMLRPRLWMVWRRLWRQPSLIKCAGTSTDPAG